MTAPETSSRWQALLTLLAEFERTPGKYPLALREPRLLFDEAHAVLLLAAGRHVDGMALPALEESSARRAARFFVRTALLRQGNDHYTLLGLTGTATPEQVREHYRLMIRLTHPDFEAGGEHWPSDAASRINIANDVLSSAVRRREYDVSLTPATTPAAPSPGPMSSPTVAAPATTHAPARRKTTDSGHRWSGGLSTRAKAALASVGAVLSAAALWWLNGSDSGSLTARQRSINEDTASYMESGLGLGKRLPAPPAQAAQSAPPEKAMTAQGGNVPVAPIIPKPAPPTTERPDPQAPAPANAVVAAVRPPVSEAETSSGMSLQIARQLTTVKPEPVAATAAEIVREPTPAPQRLTLQQVHPLMTNVLASLSGGRGENLAQWIAPEWRNRPANQAFVNQFNQWLGGQRVKEVSKVSLSSQPQGDNLVIDGVVQLTTQQAVSGEQARSLRLRALFQPQDGQAVLTQLTASEPQ